MSTLLPALGIDMAKSTSMFICSQKQKPAHTTLPTRHKDLMLWLTGFISAVLIRSMPVWRLLERTETLSHSSCIKRVIP